MSAGLAPAFRPCVIIPTYNNPVTIRRVVERVRGYLADVVVVDDGSDEETRAAVAAIGSDGLAHVHHRKENGGKGAAVKTGFAVALSLGFTHAIQVDADGQHTLDDIPTFLAAAKERPDALVLGAPVFDDTQPKLRAYARKLSIFFCHIETFGREIDDPQCGFRVYPLQAALDAKARGDRMDFDLEIPVRMVWDGVLVLNLPTRVRYLTEEEGGVSHFRVVSDNIRITWLHTKLVTIAILRALTSLFSSGPFGPARSPQRTLHE